MTKSIGLSRRRLLIALGAAGVACGLDLGVPGSARAETVEAIKAKGKLAVGVVTDQVPFGFINERGENDGYDVAIAKLIAGELGVEPRLQPVTTVNRIPLLLTGRVDVLVSVLSIFPERAKVIQYVAPYALVDAGVYGPVDQKVTTVEELAGKVIGVEKGSGMDKALTDRGGFNIQRYDDASSAAQALLSGQVEFLGTFSQTFMGVERAAPGKFDRKVKFFSVYEGIAVRPNSGEFGDWLASYFIKIRDDGTLAKLHQQYFGTPLPELPTTIADVPLLITGR